MKWLERTERILAGGVAVLAGTLIVVLWAIVVLQVVDRHFVDVPLDAPDQLVRIGLVWLTFIGFALALNDRANIRVDLIDKHLPRAVRRVIAVAFDVMFVAILAYLALKTWPVLQAGAGQSLLGTPFNVALPVSGLEVGSIAAAVFVLIRLLSRRSDAAG